MTLSQNPTLWGSLLVLKATPAERWGGVLPWLTSLLLPSPPFLAGVAHHTGVGSSLQDHDLPACVRGLGLLSLETPGVFTQPCLMCSFLVFFFLHLLFNPAWTPSARVSPVTGVTSLCTRSGCPLVLRSHTDVFRMTWHAACSLKYFSSNSNNRKWRKCGKLHPHFQVMVHTLITGVALYWWGSSCDSPPKRY